MSNIVAFRGGGKYANKGCNIFFAEYSHLGFQMKGSLGKLFPKLARLWQLPQRGEYGARKLSFLSRAHS